MRGQPFESLLRVVIESLCELIEFVQNAGIVLIELIRFTERIPGRGRIAALIEIGEPEIAPWLREVGSEIAARAPKR